MENSGTTVPLYRGMDRLTLDRQYDAQASVPSFEAEQQLRVIESARVQSAYSGYETVVFDEVRMQKLDIFRAGA